MTEPLWLGRPLTDLSKEELIVALKWAMAQYRILKERHEHDMDMLMGDNL